jgi:DNA-binding response OmpR family regulator
MVGADDYLVKPFTSLQIDEKLEQAGLTQQMGGLADRQGLSCR